MLELFIVPDRNQTKAMWVWGVGLKKVAHAVAMPVTLDGKSTVTVTYEHEGDGHIEGYVDNSFSLPALNNVKMGGFLPYMIPI